MLTKIGLTTIMIAVIMMVCAGSATAQKPKPAADAREAGSGMPTGKRLAVTPIDITFASAADFRGYVSGKFLLELTVSGGEGPNLKSTDVKLTKAIAAGDATLSGDSRYSASQPQVVRIYLAREVFTSWFGAIFDSELTAVKNGVSGLNIKVAFKGDGSRPAGVPADGARGTYSDKTTEDVNDPKSSAKGVKTGHAVVVVGGANAENRITISTGATQIVETDAKGKGFTPPHTGGIVFTITCDKLFACWPHMHQFAK